MSSRFAAGTLVLLGVVIAVLGFVLAGSVPLIVIGLLAIFAGGVLSLAGERGRL